MKHCATCRCASRSEYDDTMRRLDVPHNSRSDKACRVLSVLGFRFLVDFGVYNAEQLADSEAPGWETDFSDLWNEAA